MDDDTAMSGEAFTCANCRGTFIKARSDEEALAEAQTSGLLIPGDDDPVLVCDDCYVEMRAWMIERQRAGTWPP